MDADVQVLLAAERAAADELRFRAYRRLVFVHTQLRDDAAAARRAYDFAEALHARLGSRPTLQVSLLEAAAELAAAEGEPTLALRQLEAGLALAEQLDPNHPRVDSLRLALANELANELQSKRAIELYLDIAQDRRRRLGVRHPDVARVEFNLGLTYLDIGDVEQAKTHVQAALDIQELAYGDSSPVLAPTLAKLGEIQLALDDPQGAVVLGRRAHAIELAALPADDVARINGARIMAHAHIAQAQFEEALAADQAALAAIDPSLVEPRAGLEHEIGWLLCRLGRHEQAAAYLERARLNGDELVRRQAALSLVDVELSRGNAERALAQIDGLAPADADELPEYTAQYRWLRARALLAVHGRSDEVDELIAAARATYNNLPRPDITASLDELYEH
jgi:tetratricopeptide (TPR) repeat protein